MLRRLLTHPATLRRAALASIIANIVIVVTGGAVRLTGSGLGCPTWPRCTDDSLTTTAEMGVHGVIEFGNRTLSGVVGAIALACVVLALIQRRDALRLALLAFAGVIAQGVIGGITVRTGLNPWIVASHFLVSMWLIGATYVLWHRVSERPAVLAPPPPPLRTLGWLTATASAVVLVIGTVVTGSGPHAGDLTSGRMGFDPAAMSQLHTDAVFLLIGLSVAMWYALRAVNAPRAARFAGVLVLVELSQGLIGAVQYATDLPEVLVGAHMLGACLVWVATVALLRELTRRPAPAAGPDTDGPSAGSPSAADPSAADPSAANPSAANPSAASPSADGHGQRRSTVSEAIPEAAVSS